MAGDPNLTRLLLGMGLREFSMHPSQIPAVKQKVKQSDISELIPITRRILAAYNAFVADNVKVAAP